MSFTVEIGASKEEIFERGDEECRMEAEYLRKYGGIYVDYDFAPEPETLGKLKDIETGEKDEEDLENEWISPQKFSNFTIYRHNNYGKYQLWTDPWPFHVCQGRLGDCWLIAAIMTITRKKKLLEELIPKNNYTFETGVVQVRLFIDGQWRVIKTDYHLPHVDGFERFAKMPKKQAWVAFVEKAYAKTRGTYGGLGGGHSDKAFTALTGCMSTRYNIDKEVDKEKLWKDLNKWIEEEFLICVATPDQEDFSKEKRWYDRHMISDCHAYALLGVKQYLGHRLLHFGSNSTLKWNGKWSDKPGYDDDVLKKMSVQDRELSDKKTFWMEIDDFVNFFHLLYVGEYREGWKEIRVKETVKRGVQDNVQVLRIDIEKPCQIVLEVTSLHGNQRKTQNMFLNIHKSIESTNELGELIGTFHRFDSQISTEIINFESPGTYLCLLIIIENSMTEMENQWVIRSNRIDSSPPSSPQSSYSFRLVSPIYLINSLQKMIEINGKMEKIEKDSVIIYTWNDDQSTFIMIDNMQTNNFLRVKGTVTSPVTQKIKKGLMFNEFLPRPVPPMSRSIVGYYSKEEYGKPDCSVDISYTIQNRYIDWLSCAQYAVSMEWEAGTTPLTAK